MACSGFAPSSGNSCEGFITQFTVQKHKRDKALNAHGHDNVFEIGVFSHGDQHRTIGVTQEITRRTQISTVAHLTCVGLTKQELITVLHTYRDAKISAILALRGDPHGGPRAPWTPNSAGFSHADALVQLIAVFGGFKIGVAAFPDGHPSSNGNYEKDIEVLLRKENLGASFATTHGAVSVT